MKTCAVCSAENTAESEFCSACGSRLEAAQEVTVDQIPPGNTGNTAASPPPVDAGSSTHGRFLPGARIAGRYRIVSLAGRGGMGEVYRADDLKLGHPVALKFLPREVGEGSRRFQMFLSEVRCPGRSRTQTSAGFTISTK